MFYQGRFNAWYYRSVARGGVGFGGTRFRGTFKQFRRLRRSALARVYFYNEDGINGSSLVGGILKEGSVTHMDSGPNGAVAVGFCGISGMHLISLPNCKCTGIGRTRGLH